MKKNLVISAVLTLFVLAVAASAQTPNFSGNWDLDVSKSKLGDRNNIKSQTLAITQTATDIKVVTASERTPPPADAPAGGRPGGGGMGGRGGDGTATYTIDGKDVKTEVQNQMGTMTVTTNAKIDGGKLVVKRTTTTPNGDRVSSESWELSTDGNTLTITAQRPNRDGGTDTTTRVFAKKP
jgi:hypothetical protein